ncbi:TIGR02569 family protein [Corynebacterium sp. zg254]|uniref:TIGR02569 family protein n=1 Tax=Corynebacterium zhongnanshanii TaxID=2768834 RepID=A0ABQ6VIP3_9CORY|nr:MULTISPECIES: TIGR02569 family protein [Corynebacterium]KAB3522996.1 TIGR02569 family protein [Corynebacterium zhongnanshanii]MCR5913919.1 TIGR02569 family protein [Corynebacterium sp. zg254]
MTQPPAHILTSFQVPTARPTRVEGAWAGGWRCDHAVISRADDPARAAWISKTMTKIRPVGVSVSRPISSSDGRFSVSGWRARTFLSGAPSPRFDEMAAAALKINDALAGEARPSFLRPPEVGTPWRSADIFAAAEEAAFADNATQWIAPVLDAESIPREDVAQALMKAAHVLDLREEIHAADQVVHADVVGCVMFDDASDPIFTDIVPTFRPYAWSVALLAVDSIAWASAPDALLDRWAHLEDFDQLLVRAVVYRLCVHIMHPDARPEAWPGLQRCADVVAGRIRRQRHSG